MHSAPDGNLMLLLFTSQNIASRNIAQKLIDEHGFQKKEENIWEKDGIKLIETNAPSVLDVPTDFDTDCLIILSTHKSKSEGQVLTAHVPGNWNNADFGGERRTLNIAHASMLKTLAKEIKKQADLIGWKFSLEADHHGPTCNVPIIFVEIGNNEEQWKNEKAASAMANAVASAIKHDEEYETVFGVGGGHYTRAFTKIALETELAVGHIAPKYVVDDIDEDTFRQAIEKNVEKLSKVLISKEEVNAKQREKIRELCKKFSVDCEII